MSELTAQFEGRILAFDQDAARIWGQVIGDGDRSGRPHPAADAQIAAIAILHRLTLVTRNTKDFARIGVVLFDPWTSGSDP